MNGIYIILSAAAAMLAFGWVGVAAVALLGAVLLAVVRLGSWNDAKDEEAAEESGGDANAQGGGGRPPVKR